MHLSKTDFLKFLHCSNSLWLSKHKPDLCTKDLLSDYQKKIINDGYEVEAYVKEFLSSQSDACRYSYQSVFSSERGLYAKADVTRDNGDGTINIYEVKSSTSVQRKSPQNQIKDATFQKIVATEVGFSVKSVFIVHLNSEYVRAGVIAPENLLTFSDITIESSEMDANTQVEIDAALELLKSSSIDESSCSCRGLTKSNHCDTFDYFNSNIPDPSIYNLPRISKSKLLYFVSDERFDLDEIALHEVTERQAIVLRSAHLKEPIINHKILENWFSRLEYPIHSLDYETYASAVPILTGARPHSPIPFQYSLHIKRSPDSGLLDHVEYLAEEAAMPIAMLEHMEKHIGDNGSIISWHASFENTQNENMAKIYPEKRKFLDGLVDRTIDLEDLFKEGYVDIKFQGSTSIKKVLPALLTDPELDYTGMKVANGTDAMEAWRKLLTLPTGTAKKEQRKSMLEYCYLDTLAMVRIFEFVQKL